MMIIIIIIYEDQGCLFDTKSLKKKRNSRDHLAWRMGNGNPKQQEEEEADTIIIVS